MKIRGLFLGYAILFIGNTLLLTQRNVPATISILCILLGHILIIIFGKTKIGLHKILKVDFFLGCTLVGYYFIFNKYSLGLIHNVIVALILWISSLCLQNTSKNL